MTNNAYSSRGPPSLNPKVVDYDLLHMLTTFSVVARWVCSPCVAVQAVTAALLISC